MTMTRRSLLGLFFVPMLARWLPNKVVEWKENTARVPGAVGGIEHARYPFWRNQQAYGTGDSRAVNHREMDQLFTECERQQR